MGHRRPTVERGGLGSRISRHLCRGIVRSVRGLRHRGRRRRLRQILSAYRARSRRKAQQHRQWRCQRTEPVSQPPVRDCDHRDPSRLSVLIIETCAIPWHDIGCCLNYASPGQRVRPHHCRQQTVELLSDTTGRFATTYAARKLFRSSFSRGVQIQNAPRWGKVSSDNPTLQ